ncbi:MAG: methyl-accepting chemotaxis protein [bacterium]
MLLWMSNQPIGKKFFYTFFLLLVLFIILGITSFNGLITLNENLDQSANIRLHSYELLLQIDRDLQQTLVAERTLIFTTPNSDRFNALLKDHAENLQQSADRWIKYQTVIQTDKEKTLVTEYNNLRVIWESVTNQIVDKIKANDEMSKIAAIEQSFNEGFTAFENCRDVIDKLTQVNDDYSAQETIDNEKTYSSSTTVLTITLIISIVLSIYLGMFLTKIIKIPLLKAKEMMIRLSHGNLQTRLRLDVKDEIGEMAAAMDQMADNLSGKINQMHKISEGDLNVNFGNYSVEDEITPGFEKIVNTVNKLKDEISKLSQEAKQGNLVYRGDSNKFSGVYSNLVKGINETIDALVSPIREGAEILKILATGDLTSRMHGEYHGDHQLIKNSINSVADSLNSAMLEVNQASLAAASASNQISSSTEEMATGASEQASQVGEIASAIEEMTRTIMESTKNTSMVAEKSKIAAQKVQHGVNKVNETKSGMQLIVTSASKTGNIISNLAKQTDQIGEIAQVINDIADQTNLLALNAAIEAARAGEQGRGFAVVADEVRKLAERTAKATKEIADTIKTIQIGVLDANNSMGEAQSSVSAGLKLTDEVSVSLNEIMENTIDVTDLASQVSASSEELSATSEEISKSIDNISTVSNESASGVQQIARAAEDLSRLTENLQNLVLKFKIEERGVQKFKR